MLNINKTHQIAQEISKNQNSIIVFLDQEQPDGREKGGRSCQVKTL